MTWTLTPSALRYDTARQRSRALNLLADFKRYAKMKLGDLPKPDDELQWVQLARHYGLPTRLLDWTRNAAIALYFACAEMPATAHPDGTVFIINPKDLNRQADERIENPRIFDAHTDAGRIERYLTLSGDQSSRGVRTIAINPVWNSERILLQQGAFTLHGSREFTLTSRQVSSLVCLKVPAVRKEALLHELERAGINEMSIFPEPEHMCRYLVWREKLDAPGAQ
ncbi:MAG: FRG domain-containing protein [Sedimentisphaerales bacterium]|nr:FRG domain-containing protein [Sedimentisphaerales bacterium]